MPTRTGRQVVVALCPLVSLAGAAMLACNSGGGGGGTEGLVAGDVGMGRFAYSGVCYDCHGTPGQNNADAPDLAETAADRLQAAINDNQHDDVPKQGLDKQTYLDIEAYLGSGTFVQGSGDMPCASLPDTRYQAYYDTFELDMGSGTTETDALVAAAVLCQTQMLLEDGALFQDCLDCLTETVESLYGIGGPCTYDDLPGVATIVSVEEPDPQEANCANDPVEVMFDFAATEPQNAGSLSPDGTATGLRLSVGDGRNPPRSWIESEGLTVGSQHPCVASVIVTGGCPPLTVVLTEVDYDAGIDACD